MSWSNLGAVEKPELVELLFQTLNSKKNNNTHTHNNNNNNSNNNISNIIHDIHIQNLNNLINNNDNANNPKICGFCRVPGMKTKKCAGCLSVRYLC